LAVAPAALLVVAELVLSLVLELPPPLVVVELAELLPPREVLVAFAVAPWADVLDAVELPSVDA
jgi:hypothetical protein